MPPWLQRLIDRLNQEPEPGDIVQAEIRFIRLCRIDTLERRTAFREAYGDTVQQVVDVGARLYPQTHGGKQLTDQEKARWREEIETGFYDELYELESSWAEE